MSSRNNDNNPYSASDIEKYLKGELPAREMHDLEQAALEDPFLADALEGMKLHPGIAQPPPGLTPNPNSSLTQAPHPSLQDDLIELRQKLTAKITQTGHATSTRTMPTRTIRRRIALAAVFLLLLGIGFTFFYFNAVHKGSSAYIADNKNSPAAAPAPRADSTAPATAIAPALPEQKETALARTTPAKTVTTPAKTTPTPQKTVTTPPAEAVITPPAKAAATQPGLQISKDSIPYTPAQTMTSAFYKNTLPSLVYSGKVLDAQNRPLAGAQLFLKDYTNTNLGVVTDQLGEFKIFLHPQDSTRMLTVAMVGYDQASLALNTLSTDRQADNVIHLQPHLSNLDEVVITGYGYNRKETRAAIPSGDDEKLDTGWQKATPIIGREAYLLYLQTAKKKLGLDSTITGTETISFELDKTGIPASFKIEQSLSPAHDAGVIRLIIEGSAWRLVKSRKVRAAVSIIF